MLFLTACKKDQVANLRNQISGEWEYVTFSGYPFLNNSLPPGNGKIIVIGKNGSFERRNHDTTIFKGSYLLEERKDCYGDEKYVFFKTSDSTFPDYKSIRVVEGRLHLSSPNCYQDGGTSIYRKL